jgi:hypothetical protein
MPSGGREGAAAPFPESSRTRRAERPLLPRRDRIFVSAAVPPSTSDTAASANASTERPNNVIAASSQPSSPFDAAATGLITRGCCDGVTSVAGRVTGDALRAFRSSGVVTACLVATRFFGAGAVFFGVALATT